MKKKSIHYINISLVYFKPFLENKLQYVKKYQKDLELRIWSAGKI